jgi:nucleotide-binding universal stress UspA family protein
MFPTKILLATDGSKEATSAARLATMLSGTLDSELHLAHVAPMPSALAWPESVYFSADYWEEAREFARREAGEKLDEEARKIREEMGGAVAEAHATAGRPDAEIIRLAEEVGAGLVVVGSRGFGLVRRTLLGSVSSSVARHAHCPVLVVRNEWPGEGSSLPGRILLATDGSGEADEAAQTAAEISGATGSELHLVYVSLAESLYYPGLEIADIRADQQERTQERARAWIDDRAERLRAEGVDVEATHLRLGEPDREIVRLAEALDAGLIVVGSRGLGGVNRALLGSVSDSVVRHAHCPVLVVRGEGRRRTTAGQATEQQGETRS